MSVARLAARVFGLGLGQTGADRDGVITLLSPLLSALV